MLGKVEMRDALSAAARHRSANHSLTRVLRLGASACAVLLISVCGVSADDEPVPTAEANPGLAALGPFPPAGTEVRLPDLAEIRPPEKPRVRIWD